MSPHQIPLPLGRYLPPMGSTFVAIEALGGVVLLAATIVALVWANVSLTSYAHLWSTHLTIGVGELSITKVPGDFSASWHGLAACGCRKLVQAR